MAPVCCNIDRIESGRVTAVDVETEMLLLLPNPNGYRADCCRSVGSRRCLLYLRMAFINLRGSVHAIQVTRGIYTLRKMKAVTHFQALSSALSATVGLGNTLQLPFLWEGLEPSFG